MIFNLKKKVLTFSYACYIAQKKLNKIKMKKKN